MSARAIPTLLSAPGAGFATSNKPDLYSSARVLRERSGHIWNRDPSVSPLKWNPLVLGRASMGPCATLC